MLSSLCLRMSAKLVTVLSAALSLLFFALWIIGPTLIAQAYDGESLFFLNALIEGQDSHELDKYISTFHGLMATSSVIFVWVIVLLNHMIWRYRAGTEAFKSAHQPAKIESENWIKTVSLYSILILASLFILMVSHGKTYLSVMTHDTFVYFDGAHRINMGQVPHVDFHTPLGAAAYVLPYLGFSIRGGYAGSLEISSFLVAVILALVSIILLRGRSTALFSVTTILFVSLIVVVPRNLGTSGELITHAMYYNRWAWAVLTLIFISYILPSVYSWARVLLEAALLSLLIVFLFYIKVTYFVFAVAFLPILALASKRQLYLALGAGGISIVLFSLIEWRYGLTRPYLYDVWAAINSSGAVRAGLASSVLNNVIEYLLLIAAFSVLALKKSVRWSDILFVAFVGSAGLAILNQNAQSQSIVVILAALLWTYAAGLRGSGVGKSRSPSLDAGDRRAIAICLFMFMAPTLISSIEGVYSSVLGVANGANQNQVLTLHGVYIGETHSYLERVYANADPVLLFNELRTRRTRQPLSQGEYVETVNEGMKLLESGKVFSGKIVTFDLANPFNFLTGGMPPTNDYSWFHAGRNISKSAHQPPRELFQDINYIMVPTFPMAYPTTKLLWEIYGGYVAEKYKVLAKSRYWTLYERGMTITFDDGPDF